MNNTFFRTMVLIVVGWIALKGSAQGIDMQAHVASDEGKAAYTAYLQKQAAYYTGNLIYDSLMTLDDATLFGRLNALMGTTCRLGGGGFSYNSLRWDYVNVDKDLNTQGNIIGYYDGQSMNGTWDSGVTYNREHTWPQSKGASKNIAMGYDMQSVRPASTAINSDRGNVAYGESGSYYDPNDVAINNPLYRASNNGTYRGDAARVILYDYLVYGQYGGYQNALYNGNAQLLDKLGLGGVFESLMVMLKWHMQDPPSLTEMVRNDGAQTYQGNRNPFIDFPEIAMLILKNNANVTSYPVNYSTSAIVQPHYDYTTPAGFVCYVSAPDGSHPANLSVTGAGYLYDSTLGRLTITNVSGAVNISVSGLPQGIEETTETPMVTKYFRNGRLVIVKDGTEFDVLGNEIKN